MFAWISARLAEKQLAISGVDPDSYGHTMRELSGDRLATNEDKILTALVVQAKSQPGGIEVLDRDKFLSALLRWERQKGAGWMKCCSLVRALLNEDAARSQYPEYDEHKHLIDL